MSLSVIVTVNNTVRRYRTIKISQRCKPTHSHASCFSIYAKLR